MAPTLRSSAVLILAALVASSVTASAQPPTATEVKVETVKPAREKHSTLRFLKENRDFIRARFDLLRERPLERHGGADALDPRFLAYQAMLSEILAAEDSLAVADDAERRRELLESIRDLGDLETRLDLLERLLAEQRERLAALQEDFTGRQRTALVVVLSGFPAAADPETLSITVADAATVVVALHPEERDALRRGGVVQVFHGFVEPREQVIGIDLAGAGWPSGHPGYVTLVPPRDKLTFLEIDLSNAIPHAGTPSVRASTWLHDSDIPGGG